MLRSHQPGVELQGRNLAGVRRSSIPSSCFWRSRISSKAVAGNEALDDKRDPAGARTRGDKRRTNRGALPAHLPRIDVTIAPGTTAPVAARPCM